MNSRARRDPLAPMRSTVALSFVLTACGGGATSAPPPTSPATTEPAATPAGPTSDTTTTGATSSGATSSKPASFSHPDHPGLQITDLKFGTGPEVKPGDTIEVNYVGTLEDGTIFDQTQNGPVTFPIGKGMLIKGWDAGVPGMRVGGVRRLFVPASLGYGQKGAPPKIPPYSALIFEIELLAIK